MVEEICGKALRSNFEDVEYGPDHPHPSDNKCSSDKDEGADDGVVYSSDDYDTEEPYADPVPQAKAGMQNDHIVEVLQIRLRQLDHEYRITGVPLVSTVV